MMKNHKTNFALSTLYLYLTDNCNLSCSHCWISPTYSKNKQQGIPAKMLKKTISEAKSLGLATVKLTGGEPLLYKELRDLLSFLATEKLTIFIETNGTLIDQDMLETFKACRVDQISVSLDASSEKIHDELRGRNGGFEDALRGLTLLSNSDLNFQIIMTLQRKNRKEIPGMILLSEKLGAGSLKINHLVPCGRGKEAFKRKQNLELDELIQLYRMVQKEWFPRSHLEIIFDVPAAFRSLEEIKLRGVSECHILNILGILANGEFSICGIGQTIKGLRMGHVNHDTIGDVWQNNAILKDLRASLPKKLNGICGQCIFKFQCLGACRANAYALTDDLLAPYFLCQELFESGCFPSSRRI